MGVCSYDEWGVSVCALNMLALEDTLGVAYGERWDLKNDVRSACGASVCLCVSCVCASVCVRAFFLIKLSLSLSLSLSPHKTWARPGDGACGMHYTA